MLAAFVLLSASAAFMRLQLAPERVLRLFGGEVLLALPAGWVADRVDHTVRAHPPTLDPMAPSLAVQRLAKADDPEMIDIQLARVEEERRSSGVAYRTLERAEKRSFGGHASLWTSYALVRDPAADAGGGAVLPEVLRGVDILVRASHDRFYLVSAVARASEFDDGNGDLQRTLEKIRFRR